MPADLAVVRRDMWLADPPRHIPGGTVVRVLRTIEPAHPGSSPQLLVSTDRLFRAGPRNTHLEAIVAEGTITLAIKTSLLRRRYEPAPAATS
jgi:hypothetical protein